MTLKRRLREHIRFAFEVKEFVTQPLMAWAPEGCEGQSQKALRAPRLLANHNFHHQLHQDGVFCLDLHRTDGAVLEELCQDIGYTPQLFEATDLKGRNTVRIFVFSCFVIAIWIFEGNAPFVCLIFGVYFPTLLICVPFATLKKQLFVITSCYEYQFETTEVHGQSHNSEICFQNCKCPQLSFHRFPSSANPAKFPTESDRAQTETILSNIWFCRLHLSHLKSPVSNIWPTPHKIYIQRWKVFLKLLTSRSPNNPPWLSMSTP